MEPIIVRLVVVSSVKVDANDFYEFLAKQAREYFTSKNDSSAGIVVGPNEINNLEDLKSMVLG